MCTLQASTLRSLVQRRDVICCPFSYACFFLIPAYLHIFFIISRRRRRPEAGCSAWVGRVCNVEVAAAGALLEVSISVLSLFSFLFLLIFASVSYLRVFTINETSHSSSQLEPVTV
jgi:hypothetical protein